MAQAVEGMTELSGFGVIESFSSDSSATFTIAHHAFNCADAVVRAETAGVCLGQT